MGAFDPEGHGSGSLLEAKLRAPALPAGHVARPELIDRVTQHDGGRVVTVTAPAGYGKTTLLAEWAASEQRPVAWVSLDESDNDPVALLQGLAAAFGPTQGLPSSFWESMAGPGASVLGRLAPRLTETMRSADAPFTVMLDDVHEVTSVASHDVIDLVVSGIPDGSSFVLAGRTEPPALASWRVRVPVVELGVDHLAFDVDETSRFFDLGGSGLSDGAAREVHGQLEGWIAGLQLALVVARRDPTDAAGTHERFVVDYLRREVLSGLPDDLRDFMVRTSVLRQLSAELCDSILGRDDSAARLDHLEKAQLFLTRLDGRGVWYRYHAAFRELLLEDLDRTHGGGARPTLHRAASQWYEGHGMGEEAVEHSLAGGDTDAAVRLVATTAQAMNSRGRLATVDRWMGEIGPEAIVGYPPLAVLAGWSAALSGDAPAAERWAAALDELDFSDTPADRTASFESSRAMFRAMLCAAGPEAMLADAELALRLEPTWSPWRSTAEGLAGEALLLRDDPGDREAAFTLFEDAAQSARAAKDGDTSIVWRAEAALLAMDRGDWSRARDDVAAVLALAEDLHLTDYFISQIGHAAAARLAVHDGDRERALSWAATAMRSRGVATYAIPHISVRIRLVLARVHLALGQPATARHLLREVDGLLRRRPRLGSLVGQAEEVRGLAAAAEAVGDGVAPLSPAELRVLPYLQTHLTFEQMGGRLYISRNTVSSHAKSIYRKLGVSSRRDAVAKAAAVGLLGDGATA